MNKENQLYYESIVEHMVPLEDFLVYEDTHKDLYEDYCAIDAFWLAFWTESESLCQPYWITQAGYFWWRYIGTTVTRLVQEAIAS